MLTTKQDNFCRNIVKGMTAKDSYINAYDTKCNDNTAWVEATKLMKRDDIQQRITDLRKPLELVVQSNAISARQKQIDFIQERIEICKQNEDEQSIIRYTDMLNKLYALYKETESIEQEESSVNSLDLNTLKKLSKMA